MSLQVTIEFRGDAELAALTAALEDRQGLNRRVAQDALLFIRKFGASKSQGEHRTATRLGAKPTGHLVDAYRGIESEHDDQGAALLVPRASRLRAAFGDHTITPKNSRYLTLPVHRDSYGRRAREFNDLFALRVGPKKSLVLARTDASGNLETMYFLATSVNIKEDASLIPFEEIYEGAADSVEVFLDEALERGLA